ncbi:hypothetical protein ACQB60_40920 [Actinomycetota bacterium Odt1-20B]
MRILPAIEEVKSADSGRFTRVMLSGNVGKLPVPLREPVARYLLGSQVLVAAGHVTDPLSPEKGAVVPFGFSTDGEWAWPTYWGYFVREYGAHVPDDFVACVQKRNFHPPQLSSDEVAAAMNAVQRALSGSE